MKLEMPKVAEPISYDSASPELPRGDAKSIADAVLPLLEAEARITISSRGEIRGVEFDEGAKKAVEALAAAKALRSLLSEEGLAAVLRQSLVVLPEREVSAGDKWSHEVPLATPLGQAKQKTTFSLQEPDEKSPNMARIKSVTELTFEQSAGGKRPVLKQQDQSGLILFDTKSGRLQSASVEQELVTTSQLKDTPVEVRLTSTLKTTLEPK
jgi:hypothetical protein